MVFEFQDRFGKESRVRILGVNTVIGQTNLDQMPLKSDDLVVNLFCVHNRS